MMNPRQADDLDNFDPRDFDGEYLFPEEILHIVDLCDAVWVHDGDPGRPHAVTTDGLCTDGFFDVLRVIERANISMIFAGQLVDRLIEKDRQLLEAWPLKCVVGSAYAAITFSQNVAYVLQTRYGARKVIHREIEKGVGKEFVWQRRTLEDGTLVVNIEELIKSKGTVQKVRNAIQAGNEFPIQFSPYVGTIVLRPPQLTSEYDDIVALVKKEIQTWDPKECPLCRRGSKRISSPKKNWKELTGK
jgi:hypothetical protein